MNNYGQHTRRVCKILNPADHKPLEIPGHTAEIGKWYRDNDGDIVACRGVNGKKAFVLFGVTRACDSQLTLLGESTYQGVTLTEIPEPQIFLQGEGLQR